MLIGFAYDNNLMVDSKIANEDVQEILNRHDNLYRTTGDYVEEE